MIRELFIYFKIIRLICKIWRWHDTTFVDLPQLEQEKKHSKEVDEYIEAKAKYIKANKNRRNLYRPHYIEETVDTIITGLNLLKYPEFYERTAVKHNQNRIRTWNGVQHDD